MQRTTVDMSTAADGSLEQEEIIHLQVVVGVDPDNQTSPIATSCKIVIFSDELAAREDGGAGQRIKQAV